MCSIATQCSRKKVENFLRSAIQEAMALGAQLPIRLEPDVEKRLDEIAQKTGTSKSGLIRLLAKTFVDHVVLPDGSISLPPNWKELLPLADGRSTKKPSVVEAESDATSSKSALKIAAVVADRIRAKRKR